MIHPIGYVKQFMFQNDGLVALLILAMITVVCLLEAFDNGRSHDRESRR